GRRNVAVLEDQGAAMRASVVETFRQTGSYDAAKSKAAEYEQQLRKQLGALGLSKTAVDTYVRALGLTPDLVETTVALSGDEDARTRIGLLNTAIDDLPDTTELEVNSKIAMGDYKGALAIVQQFYRDHPVVLGVTLDINKLRNSTGFVIPG